MSLTGPGWTFSGTVGSPVAELASRPGRDLAGRYREVEFKYATPDGAARQVADNIMFPNGMVVTPDNSTLIVAESWVHRLTAFDIADDGSLSNRRVWAEVDGDGICLDAEGAIWCSGVSGGQPECLRVREGGEVLERIIHDAACFACMLGGADGKTLFLMNAEWRGVERMGELFQSKTGKIETVRVAAPHAGRP